MTPTRISGPITWLAVFLAVAQVVAPVVPFSGFGASPNESTTDLLITPAGYTFSIWSLIYLLSIVFAIAVVRKGATGTDDPRRLLIDLEVAFAGAAVWILVSAAEWTWVTPIVLTVMTVVLLDAARIAARLVSFSSMSRRISSGSGRWASPSPRPLLNRSMNAWSSACSEPLSSVSRT